MKKYSVIAATVVLAAVFALLLGGSARAASFVYGPFVGNSPDEGSCSTTWAQDFYNRQFTADDTNVNPTPTHPAVVREDFLNATFVTLSGPGHTPEASPGSCSGGVAMGKVDGNVHGQFTGYEDIVVVGGHFNPEGCNVTGANCSGQGATTNHEAIADLISALYGSVEDIGSGGAFAFDYVACTTGMGHWTDSSDANGNEVFTGDITGSASSQVNPNNPACPQPPSPTPSPTPKPPTPTPVPPTPTPVPPTPTPPTTTPGLPNTGSDPNA